MYYTRENQLIIQETIKFGCFSYTRQGLYITSRLSPRPQVFCIQVRFTIALYLLCNFYQLHFLNIKHYLGANVGKLPKNCVLYGIRALDFCASKLSLW